MKSLKRGAFFLALLCITINMIRLAQGQPLSSNISQINSTRVVNGTKTVVRVHDTAQRPQVISPQQSQSVASSRSPSGTICGVESRAAHGQIAPNTNGGTLNPVAFINPTTVNASGRIAFNSQVDGSDRNQGVFVADSDGTISAIAIGCGGLGGGGDTTSMCGDVSPTGGHFGGFFFGTVFTPDINDAGDVLFFCDVNGGSSRRALFLYRGAFGEIVKVAAVGDPSPIGGTFGAVGPGSLNNNGKVVFLASPVGETVNSNLFMWDNGVVTKVAAIGDPAPGGGTFAALGTESFGFQDGTSIPVGPVPDITDSDQIAFRAIVSGGITERGIVVRTGQVDEWYVKVPDPTPIGGTYFDMQAASINNTGQSAFFADYHATPETTNSGWFAGAPGDWRKVVVFFDPIDDGNHWDRKTEPNNRPFVGRFLL
ncbi:MAG: choice-of-anchor tandem repeat NxxGxxAF-containing protein [Chthoniobacterales bacterium]